MLIKANNRDFQRPEPGTHQARCIGFVFLGTQHWEYKGEPKSGGKLRFKFELPGQLVKEGDHAGKPLVVWSRDFTAGLGDKSNLRKFLEQWRGTKFTKEELDGFDPKKTLGRPCLLQLSESEKNGKTYTDISSIMGVPSGITVPPQVHESIYYEAPDHDQAVYERLPEWLRKVIDISDERRGLTGESSQDQRQPGADVEEEDIPF